MPQAQPRHRHSYTLPDAYIYFYHTDEYFIIPQFPNTLNDNMDSNFSSQNALSRTAPVFSYNNSGPRTVQVSLELHRDMMNNVNTAGSKVKINIGNDVITTPDDDYVDILIKKLQAAALPRYDDSSKLVDPPRIAIRFADTVFIKGVVASGGVSIAYDLPLLANNKYAKITISFVVSETQPYDAESVSALGSFRGLTSGLKSKMGKA